MLRLFGFLFLIIGAALLYYGWRSHEAEATSLLVVRNGASSQSIGMLALGAVAAVWGLFALLRRPA